MKKRTSTVVNLSHTELCEAVVAWVSMHTAGEVTVDIHQVDFLDDEDRPFQFEVTAEASD